MHSVPSKRHQRYVCFAPGSVPKTRASKMVVAQVWWLTRRPGGMMAELDSHTPGPTNPDPVGSRFSPWHACGPADESYIRGMERTGHLALEGCVLRLQPGDMGHEAAARQWEEIFGVSRSRDLLAFTNARLGFIPGEAGLAEGLVSITVGVKGKEYHDAILERARTAGICGDGWIQMCGVKWYFSLTGHGEDKGKL